MFWYFRTSESSQLRYGNTTRGNTGKVSLKEIRKRNVTVKFKHVGEKLCVKLEDESETHDKFPLPCNEDSESLGEISGSIASPVKNLKSEENSEDTLILTQEVSEQSIKQPGSLSQKVSLIQSHSQLSISPKISKIESHSQLNVNFELQEKTLRKPLMPLGKKSSSALAVIEGSKSQESLLSKSQMTFEKKSSSRLPEIRSNLSAVSLPKISVSELVKKSESQLKFSESLMATESLTNARFGFNHEGQDSYSPNIESESYVKCDDEDEEKGNWHSNTKVKKQSTENSKKPSVNYNKRLSFSANKKQSQQIDARQALQTMGHKNSKNF